MRAPSGSRVFRLAAAVGSLLTAALLLAATPKADARSVHVVLSGDSIVEGLPTMGTPGTDLATRLQAALVASSTGRRLGWVTGGSGFIPAHATCGGGRAGCLPAGLPIETPWERTGSWVDEGILFTPPSTEGANGLPSRSTTPGSWAGTKVVADTIAVMHATQQASGTLRVLIDMVEATAGRITGGSTTVGPLSSRVGVFLPGQLASGSGLAEGTRIESTRATGAIGSVPCPCVILDRPAIADAEAVRIAATGSDPRELSFPTGSAPGSPASLPVRREITGLRWGAHSLAIGNAGGTVTFLGAIGGRSSTRANAVTVSRLGHAGALAGDDLAPNQRAAMLLVRPTLTVDMRGLNDELAEVTLRRSPAVSRALFRDALRVRFGLARSGGGGCIHVPHAPTPSVPVAVSSAYREISRSTARVNRCSWSDAFASSWTRSGATAWTTDGKHPTAAGYARLASALAKSLATRSELR